jgi:predicted regulator of Ras-like GTPase activity (Roadblock/LC7/MglB family)
MSAGAWAWLLSLLGAALFFGAGNLFALRRMALRTQRDTEAAGPWHSLLPLPRGERESVVPESSGRESGTRVASGEHERLRGEALRSMLERETRGNGFAGAVIADEAGLVVASTGEHGDALAAYGAYLAGMGARTLEALPLHELRQVIVEDDHDAVLTVRPLASADANLALVTLAPGRRAAAIAHS